MIYQGNIRKMHTSLKNEVEYHLPLYNNLEDDLLVPMNQFIGEQISISFNGQINCVVSGKRIRKTYGEGMSYDAFKSSPLAVESIIRPELSRIHEGIALRDEEWERKFHLRPHYVYLTKTAGIKVGVTSKTQIPTRWIDQGAVEGVILAETPYRQAAGLIEIALKQYISDRTNWRKMLSNVLTEDDLLLKKQELIDHLPEELRKFVIDSKPLSIKYPVIAYPEKVTSIKLDKTPVIEKKLLGIKGQYFMFEGGVVMNVRSHAGYFIKLS